jgi:hypothetical protein
MIPIPAQGDWTELNQIKLTVTVIIDRLLELIRAIAGEIEAKSQ